MKIICFNNRVDDSGFFTLSAFKQKFNDNRNIFTVNEIDNYDTPLYSGSCDDCIDFMLSHKTINRFMFGDTTSINPIFKCRSWCIVDIINVVE